MIEVKLMSKGKKNNHNNKKTGAVILTRNQGQSIQIGPDIFITVLPNVHQGTRLRVQAPRDVPITRIDRKYLGG